MARGILTEAQASDLVRLDREEARDDRPHDDEQLRLVTGFADIFVTIGLVLFLGTLAYIVRRPRRRNTPAAFSSRSPPGDLRNSSRAAGAWRCPASFSSWSSLWRAPRR